MAKISDSKGRPDENSGYARLFGNQQLGQLMSRIQAAVIRTGNELEHLIEKDTPGELKADLESILSGQEPTANIQVVFQAKMPPSGVSRGEKADDVSHAMTGREHCELLSMDYDALRERRQIEQPENLRYFISELLRIDEVRKIISELWNQEK